MVANGVYQIILWKQTGALSLKEKAGTYLIYQLLTSSMTLNVLLNFPLSLLQLPPVENELDKVAS